MARISTYPVDGTITSADKLIGTDGDNVNATVNFNIDDIKAYINTGAVAGVSSIVAGTNVTISPSGGTGAVTINATGGGGGAVSSIIAGNGIAVSSATGDVTVSESYTGLRLIVPTSVTVSDGFTLPIDDAAWNNSFMIKFVWSGVAGTATVELPLASYNTNRVFRFLSDSTFTGSNHRVNITPQSGDRIDGSTNPYLINKDYEGIKLWSDGTEWFIIQKKG